LFLPPGGRGRWLLSAQFTAGTASAHRWPLAGTPHPINKELTTMTTHYKGKLVMLGPRDEAALALLQNDLAEQG
jgi:hypothetical protein